MYFVKLVPSYSINDIKFELEPGVVSCMISQGLNRDPSDWTALLRGQLVGFAASYARPPVALLSHSRGANITKLVA